MLEFLSHNSLPPLNRVSRRTMIQAGSLGTLGLSLPSLLAGQAQAHEQRTETSRVFGQAKRVIILFMWGGPAHQDTWDLKPEAPVENRGEFLPIATNVPGIHISEHFPLIAKHADKLALIRSVGQEDNNHSTGAHAGLTGRRHELKRESFGARETDFPHFGSVLSSLRPGHSGLPSFVSLPEVISTTNGAVTPGQGGGLIGRRFDPFRIDQHPDDPDFSIESLRLPESVGLQRLSSRRELLSQFDQVSRLVEQSNRARTLSSYYQQALDMVLAPQVRQAFDIESVPLNERMRYGYHTFGQSVLMAKRLSEAGVQLVTVYWHREASPIDTTWDTHSLNFQELKLRLMPSVDRPIAALLEDLQQSGQLDETLVVWNSEFGRTPKVNGRAGRDHWGACNSVVMAGGGVPGGQVYGASDAQAAYPIANKVTQDDIAATIYHLLGFHPEDEVRDRLNRPHRLALGEPIFDLLGGRALPEQLPDPLPLSRPRIGPFAKMLRERGIRHIVCELGSPDGEREWEVSGWSESLNCEGRQHRLVGEAPAGLTFKGMFHRQFAYTHCVIRLAEPQPIETAVLTVAERAIPIPDELKQLGAQSIWQVPFPGGLTTSLSRFELKLSAPGWAVSEIAVVGEPIRDVHLQMLESYT